MSGRPVAESSGRDGRDRFQQLRVLIANEKRERLELLARDHVPNPYGLIDPR